jgi:hypothetical protein
MTAMKNFVINDFGVFGLTIENQTIENTLMYNFQPESKVKKFLLAIITII